MACDEFMRRDKAYRVVAKFTRKDSGVFGFANADGQIEALCSEIGISVVQFQLHNDVWIQLLIPQHCGEHVTIAEMSRGGYAQHSSCLLTGFIGDLPDLTQQFLEATPARCNGNTGFSQRE
ncbi:hypothetical protein D3C80_1764130 [compost metagenome]